MTITKVGKQVQEFYNDVPFPDYDLSRFDTKENLKCSMYEFAGIIDRSIPEGASIIDVGCGTGQLISFLSLRRKKVTGIDFSDSALNKARELKKKLGLDSLTLKKVNILNEEEIKPLGKFDYVLCHGVLHHTGNAELGFKNIVKLLNRGGYISIGLYHKVGRLPLKLRKFLSKTIFKNNQRVKDYFIKIQIGEIKDIERARGWWHDQYLHLYETSHLLGEVLRWFKENNIKYLQTIPSSTPFSESDLSIAGLWNDYHETYPYFPIRFYKQLTWLWKTQREGGYWLTLGRLK